MLNYTISENFKFELCIAIVVLYTIVSWYLIRYICWINNYPAKFANHFKNIADFFNIIKGENSQIKKILFIFIISTHFLGWIFLLLIVLFFNFQ